MRPRRRVGAGLSLTLGLLVGLALVILPGILTLSTQTPTSSGSLINGPGVPSTQPGNLANQPNGSSVGATVGLMLILVSLVLFPAIALSFLARYWALNRRKNDWTEKYLVQSSSS